MSECKFRQHLLALWFIYEREKKKKSKAKDKTNIKVKLKANNLFNLKATQPPGNIFLWLSSRIFKYDFLKHWV